MQIKMMQVGPLGTNCYLLEDEASKTAAVVDPAETPCGSSPRPRPTG